MIKRLVSFGWMVLVGVMLFRSVVHIRRVFSERSQAYYSEIDGCKRNFDRDTDDKRILFLYRNLGKICEK